MRSAAAFGSQGVIVPQRRSAGVNSAAWKTSAGAAARIPVVIAPNLTTTLKEFKKQGVFVLGLDGGETSRCQRCSWPTARSSSSWARRARGSRVS